MKNDFEKLGRVDGAFASKDSKSYGLMALAKGADSDSARTRPTSVGTVMAWPGVLLTEIILALLVVLVVVLVSAVAEPQLGIPADTSVPPNPAKVPWFFANVQELLIHVNPVVGGVILPSLILLGWVLVPFVDRSTDSPGRWFGGLSGAKVTVASAVSVTVFWCTFQLFNYDGSLFPAINDALNFTKLSGGVTPSGWPEHILFFGFLSLAEWSALIWEGVLPLTLLLILFGVLAILVRKTMQASSREIVMALFTASVVTLLVLGFVGTFMRGPSMEIYAPWDVPSQIQKPQ
tara:strand:- start:1178 stop:2050 length:873 start_codon:yes stop_codon:yes gene_type:complete